MNKGYSDSELATKAASEDPGGGLGRPTPLTGNESGYSGSSSLSTVFTIFPVQEAGGTKLESKPTASGEAPLCKEKYKH